MTDLPSGVATLGGRFRCVLFAGCIGFGCPLAAQPLDNSPAKADASPYPAWTYDDHFAEGDALSSTPSELEQIYRARRGMLDMSIEDSPFDFLLDGRRELEDSIGLRVGMAYTTVFQHATGGPGTRYGGSGDLDFMGQWTLLGRGTKDTGRLVFSTEYRHQIGDQPASNLRNEIGTLQFTTSGFNDREWTLRDLYWIQRMFDDRFRFGFGRADSSDFVGNHGMANLNGLFFNRAFASNTTTPFPGHGMAAAVSVRPTETFYVTAGAANGYASTTISDIPFLDEWDLFSYSEIGLTPEFAGLGRGRYRVLLWHMDARGLRDQPSDRGFSLIADQELGERLQVFARYGYADNALAGIQASAEAGFGLRGLLGHEDNMSGIAFAYSDPPSGDRRAEKIGECFHRWQMTQNTQFSISAQAIFDPSNAPDDEVLGVFSARFRVAF